MSHLRATRPRLLFLPAEAREGDQVGPRDAFEHLKSEGAISAYEAYSFLVQSERIGAEATLQEILERARNFQPTIILWQQIGLFPVDEGWFAQLRQAASQSILVVHEGDAWGRWTKRLRSPMRAACRAADLVCTSGLGFELLFRRAGARDVFFMHSFVDTVRFGTPWEPTPTREFDAVMIGNRNASRIPFRSMPGVAERDALVREMHRRFGARFALFGARWEGYPGWQGPIPYDQQESAARRSWTTVSWDHFPRASYYFSDRLPISLIAGVPHVTNYQPGYENLFPREAGLLWGNSAAEVADCVEFLLSEPAWRRNERGARGARFARDTLSARVCFERMLDVVCERFSSRISPAAAGGTQASATRAAPPNRRPRT